jgi:large subunit ribosomal protein L32
VEFVDAQQYRVESLSIRYLFEIDSRLRRFKENPMAVQQNKKSPSKRGMHRAHNALNTPGTAIEPTTGENHLRHHISPTGFYRGRKVLKTKADA